MPLADLTLIRKAVNELGPDFAYFTLNKPIMTGKIFLKQFWSQSVMFLNWQAAYRAWL